MIKQVVEKCRNTTKQTSLYNISDLETVESNKTIRECKRRCRRSVVSQNKDAVCCSVMCLRVNCYPGLLHDGLHLGLLR